MELALGTVQFGLPYGVGGRGVAVPEFEVRTILARAWDFGIRVIDTAAAYGQIEGRLARLLGDHLFKVVTKIAPMPASLSALQAVEWTHAALNQARHRLGPYLDTIMVHRGEDLLTRHADMVWAVCRDFAEPQGIRLGASCYDISTSNALCLRHSVQVVQLPGNALDQRLKTELLLQPAPVVHLRSAFLQGLLLMSLSEASERVPSAAPALKRWHAWCGMMGLVPLTAALGLVKGLPHVSHCVVGVDDLAQLEAIGAAWETAPVLHCPGLAVSDLAVIDPRNWRSQS